MLQLTFSFVVFNWKSVTHLKNYRFETWDVLKGTWFLQISTYCLTAPQTLSAISAGLPQTEALMITAEFWKDGPLGLEHIMKITHNSHEVFWTQKLSANNNGSVPFFSYEISLQINILELQNNNFSLKWFAFLSAIGVNNGLRKESC